MNIFFDIFKHRLRNLFITFYWNIEIANGFLEMKVSLIPPTFHSSKFFEKSCFTMPK